MSTLERAYQALTAAGIDVRLATQHLDQCSEPYCVAYEGRTDRLGKTLCSRHILVDALVPAAHPEQLTPSCGEIKTALCMTAGLFFEGASEAAALADYRAVYITLDFSALCGTDI